MTEIEPTPEDRERVRASLANPREHMFELLVAQEARRRVAAEERERRRALIRKLSFRLLGR